MRHIIKNQFILYRVQIKILEVSILARPLADASNFCDEFPFYVKNKNCLGKPVQNINLVGAEYYLRYFAYQIIFRRFQFYKFNLFEKFSRILLAGDARID